MEQYVEIYTIYDGASRSQYKESVNQMIKCGWIVKQIVGIGSGNGISPSITVLFERNNIEKQID